MEHKNNEAISPIDARQFAGARDRAFQDIRGEGRTYSPPEEDKHEYEMNRGSWKGFGNSDDDLDFNSALVYRAYHDALRRPIAVALKEQGTWEKLKKFFAKKKVFAH